MSNEKNFRLETNAVHAGQQLDEHGSRNQPIHLTSAYVFNDTDHAAGRFNLTVPGPVYTRLNNPTQDALEGRIAALEGGTAALATASGMSAIYYSVLGLAQSGENIVASENLYGGTHTLFSHTLPKYGVNVTLVDTSDLQNVENAIDKNTKAIFVETIGNPDGNIEDIEGLAEIGNKHGIPLIVDATFSTPYLQRPIEQGATIVVHSATKFLGGHGSAMGGLIVESGNFDWGNGNFPRLTEPDPSYHGMNFYEALGKPATFTTFLRVTLLRDTGAAISPFNAWTILQGLESLHLRIERHVENAQKVAEYLEGHDKVEWVNYAGLKSSKYNELAQKYIPKGPGSVFTFGVKGGYDSAVKFINSLDLFSLIANVGDSKSLVVHPSSTTHQQLSEEEQLAAGVKPETIRLSVGVENVDDIIEDLEQALNQI